MRNSNNLWENSNSTGVIASTFYKNANVDIFKLIAGNIENKNPGIIHGIDFTHLDVFEVCKILIEFDTNLDIHVGKSAILDLITKKTEQKEAQNNDGFFKKLMNAIKNFGCLKWFFLLLRIY